jgi:hypothetical protein
MKSSASAERPTDPTPAVPEAGSVAERADLRWQCRRGDDRVLSDRPRARAVVVEVAEATGWQPDTVRGAFAGALKERLGLEVNSEKVETRGRVYRIV